MKRDLVPLSQEEISKLMPAGAVRLQQGLRALGRTTWSLHKPFAAEYPEWRYIAREAFSRCFPNSKASDHIFTQPGAPRTEFVKFNELQDVAFSGELERKMQEVVKEYHEAKYPCPLIHY